MFREIFLCLHLPTLWKPADEGLSEPEALPMFLLVLNILPSAGYGGRQIKGVKVDHCPETDPSGQSRSPILQDALPRENLPVFSRILACTGKQEHVSGVKPPTACTE